MKSESVKLSSMSHGAGCGCKLSPQQLEEVLSGLGESAHFEKLLVGANTRDDAAVYDLGNGQALISTVDFFMPIVNDPFDFGRIASINAINDVYAMGGKPILALGILGWPVGKLPAAMASEVIRGASEVCEKAGIPMAGGHSIDNLEPLFGLAVNGLVSSKKFLTNAGAKSGDAIYLTKAIGTGILATALKRGLAEDSHIALLTETMLKSNSVGQHFATVEGIHAMTDVTGFGILGHLIEMCEGAKLSAEIEFNAIPILDLEILKPYLDSFVIPDNTFRNFSSYGKKASTLSGIQLQILCDPQTSGGLLVAVGKEAEAKFLELCEGDGIEPSKIGVFTDQSEFVVKVV